MTTAWAERYFSSRDGLRLYYRDYAGPGALRPPVLCLPGLTRNSRDFEVVAPRLARHRRVLCADLRGRGRSAHDPNWQNYHPGTYIEDLLLLLADAGVDRLVLLGTSLGGLLSMALASVQPHRVAGVILNDIGPEVAAEGRERIANYVGRHPPVTNWEEAAAQVRATYHSSLPDFTDEQWRAHARRTFSDVNGVPKLDADPKIGEALRASSSVASPDLWPIYLALLPIPVLAVRGATSDILSVETFERMAALKPDLVRVNVPNRGHTPLLEEPECLAALDEFVDRLA